MIDISMPKLNSAQVFNFANVRKLPSKINAVYFFYNKNMELLYIGKTNSLKRRLSEHIKRMTNTKAFIHEVKFFCYLKANNGYETEIYETYAINTFKPKYNKMKVYNIDGWQEQKINKSKEDDRNQTINQLVNIIDNLLSMDRQKIILFHEVREYCKNIMDEKKLNFIDRELEKQLGLRGIVITSTGFMIDRRYKVVS